MTREIARRASERKVCGKNGISRGEKMLY